MVMSLWPAFLAYPVDLSLDLSAIDWLIDWNASGD